MKCLLSHTIFILLLHVVFLDSTFAQNQESIAVIVHETIQTETINLDELLDIYTLSKQYWDNDERIRVADYKGSQAIRKDFYDVLNTTSNNIKKIWLKAQFTGRSIPPKVVNDIDEMIEIVIQNPGTIGYIPLSLVPENVTTLLVTND